MITQQLHDTNLINLEMWSSATALYLCFLLLFLENKLPALVHKSINMCCSFLYFDQPLPLYTSSITLIWAQAMWRGGVPLMTKLPNLCFHVGFVVVFTTTPLARRWLTTTTTLKPPTVNFDLLMPRSFFGGYLARFGWFLSTFFFFWVQCLCLRGTLSWCRTLHAKL